MEEIEFSVVIPDVGSDNGYYEIAFGATPTEPFDASRLDAAFSEACGSLQNAKIGSLFTARHRPSGYLMAFAKKLYGHYYIYTNGNISHINGSPTSSSRFGLPMPKPYEGKNENEVRTSDMERLIANNYRGDWCEFLNKRMPKCFRVNIAFDCGVDKSKIIECVNYAAKSLTPGASSDVMKIADRSLHMPPLVQICRDGADIVSTLNRAYIYARMTAINANDPFKVNAFLGFALSNINIEAPNALDVDTEISKIITNVDIMFALAAKELAV